MERLAKYVHVAGELWSPGQVPPGEVADLITNPKAWTSRPLGREEMAPASERGPAPVPNPDESPDEGQGDGDENGQGEDSGGSPEKSDADEGGETPAPTVSAEGDPERPAKSATVDAWRTYILAVSDATEDEVKDMTKADLIDAADQLDADNE